MFVCVACGYLWKDATGPPEECPACAAPKDKYVPYDDRAEKWVKKAVASHVMYPDEEGADLRAENSALSSHIRFALAGLLEELKR
jgi:rubredoxin